MFTIEFSCFYIISLCSCVSLSFNIYILMKIYYWCRSRLRNTSSKLRAQKKVVREQHNWNWRTLNYAFFVLECEPFWNASDSFIKISRLQSTHQYGNLVKAIFMRKGQNSACNDRNFWRFSLVWSDFAFWTGAN